MPDGHKHTWDPKTTFTGTAWYYSRYRPQYPAEAFDVLREKSHLNKSSRVLDIGCGPGNLALPLAAIAGQVYAVDPNAEMLAEARRLAKERGIGNIEFILAESNDLPELAEHIGLVDLTVMGRSFHWMDGRRTLHDLYGMTAPGGGVALLADSNMATSPEGAAILSGSAAMVSQPPAWQRAIWETTRRWLGEKRKAGRDGSYSHPEKHHQEVVAESEFYGTEVVHLTYQRTWTIDEIIGYLYSTSSHSIPVLGGKKEAFEVELRERLTASEPSGIFTEAVAVQIIMAWKR